MMRISKIIICLALGITVAGNAFGFSMWGPAEAFETQALDYGIRYLPMLPLPNESVDTVLAGAGTVAPFNIELGGTKDIGEGSRLNVPIITYGYDSTFLSYFGAKGEAAIDSAFAVLNALPASSSVSAKLTGFVTQGNQQVNYTAEALRLLDLKSTIMWLMMEHMGLIGETHTFDLLEGVLIPTGFPGAGPCNFNYVVAVRNFDPTDYSPSQYVNGTLLTYQIGQLCPTPGVGDAMEQTVQAGAPPFSTVSTREAQEVGGYYLRITRDDMGGLKYLYNKNRFVNEGLDTNAVVSATVTGFNPINLTVSNTTTTGFAGLLGGVEKITFVKTPFDSVLGTSFTPIIYRYSMPWRTNGVSRTLTVTRTVTQPDIIFTAGNLTFPGGGLPYQETLTRVSGFLSYGFAVSEGGGDPLATPRVITPEMIVTLNNSGQVYYNQGSGFLDEANNIGLGYNWGSFNGSTNAPVVFPTGASLAELEEQVLTAGPETVVGIYNPVSSSSNNVTTATQ